MTDGNSESIKEKVRALLNRANHPNTPQPEAETAIEPSFRLMQKHGLSESEIGGVKDGSSAEIVVKRVAVRGKYRVQRQNLLYVIARHHSCVGYRDDDDGDACVVVLYGRESDIFAAETIFATADLLGTRLLPRGDRSARTAWWQGFRRGIDESLGKAHKEFVVDSPGAGLVLADRVERATSYLRAHGPRLTSNYSYVAAGSDAYASGRSAGRGFSSPGGTFGSGIRGEIG